MNSLLDKRALIIYYLACTTLSLQIIKRNGRLPVTDTTPVLCDNLSSSLEVSADNGASEISTTAHQGVWRQARDPATGLPYYYCEALHVSQWDPPASGYIPMPDVYIPNTGGQLNLNKAYSGEGEDSEANIATDQGLNVTHRMYTTGMLPQIPEKTTAKHTRFLDDGSAVCSDAEGGLTPCFRDQESMEQIESSFYDEPSRRPSNKVPPSLFKYWLKRYSLFSRYDQGILMDYDSWFSVTPEVIAWHQAKRARQCFDHSCVVVDAFAGAGGNAIQFALAGCHVIAIEIDSRRAGHLAHNAAIYGVSDRIEIVNGDFLKLSKGIHADVAFFSPPWGGPNYYLQGSYDVESMGGQEAFGLRNLLKKVFNEMKCCAAIFWFPRNSSLSQLDNALSVLPEEHHRFGCEVECTELNGFTKGLTVYYGKVAKGAGKTKGQRT